MATLYRIGGESLLLPVLGDNRAVRGRQVLTPTAGLLFFPLPSLPLAVQGEGVFELTLVATFYCLGLAGLFLGLWMFYDRRDHARFEAERRRTSFHCVRCDHLYALPGEEGMGTCPQCGQQNTPLRF